MSQRSIGEIKELLEKYKEELKRKYKLKEIGIFGSYVREEQKETSDIDILETSLLNSKRMLSSASSISLELSRN